MWMAQFFTHTLGRATQALGMPADLQKHLCNGVSCGYMFTRTVADLGSALAAVELWRLQLYWVHTQQRGLPAAPQQQSRVAEAAVGVGLQRGACSSRFALPPLHAPGLTKEAHIQDSALLPSPFATTCPLDDDMCFAAEATARLGPFVRTWRSVRTRALCKLSKRLLPWEAELVAHMPPSVKSVAAERRPMFMLACALLMRWPDETNPLRFVSGYDIVGDIEVSGLFRPLRVDDSAPTGLDVLLGDSARPNLRDVFSRVKSGEHDESLRDMTLDEVHQGFANGPYTLAQLDAQFGARCWRPLERFVHVQSCGKLRCVDSGKRPGHNAASRERETIFTCSVDVIPASIMAVRAQAAQLWPPESACPFVDWMHFVLGTEDMKNAYRQCPVVPRHRCCSVVAFWDHLEHDVRFIILNGLPFGLSSAVLAFNRTPALLTAVARRMCGAMTAYFFDDSGVLDIAVGQGSAQAATRSTYQLAGALLDLQSRTAPLLPAHFLASQSMLARPRPMA